MSAKTTIILIHRMIPCFWKALRETNVHEVYTNNAKHESCDTRIYKRSFPVDRLKNNSEHCKDTTKFFMKKYITKPANLVILLKTQMEIALRKENLFRNADAQKRQTNAKKHSLI